MVFSLSRISTCSGLLPVLLKGLPSTAALGVKSIAQKQFLLHERRFIARPILEGTSAPTISRDHFDPAMVYINWKIGQLRRNTLGQWYRLPQKFIDAAQPFYDVDLRKVKYAENLGSCYAKNTAVTFEYEIFFPYPINPCQRDLHWMLHELTHVEQYVKLGGLRPFIHAYIKDGVKTAISQRTLDPHDKMVLEMAAEARAWAHREDIARRLAKNPELPNYEPAFDITAKSHFTDF